jgi:hypothetical protein
MRGNQEADVSDGAPEFEESDAIHADSSDTNASIRAAFILVEKRS